MNQYLKNIQLTHRTKIFITTLFLLSFLNVTYSQNPLDSLTHKIIEFKKDKEFIGFVVGIVDEDSLIYSKGFGYADEK